MSQPKVVDSQFIDFLIATPSQATATEAQRTQPDSANPAAHDAYTRPLHRLEPASDALWLEAQPEVRRTSGVLALDDTVLDKPYARKMDSVHHMWSGKHHRVVKGINLLTLLWSDGDRHVPCDYRIYDKPNDQKTKDDHFGYLWSLGSMRTDSSTSEGGLSGPSVTSFLSVISLTVTLHCLRSGLARLSLVK